MCTLDARWSAQRISRALPMVLREAPQRICFAAWLRPGRGAAARFGVPRESAGAQQQCLERRRRRDTKASSAPSKLKLEADATAAIPAAPSSGPAARDPKLDFGNNAGSGELLLPGERAKVQNKHGRQ
jgi:hypothetical protein